MDFEQMQVVWDAQKERRVFAMDLEALHESVRRRGRRISRTLATMEIGMIVICAVMFTFFVVKVITGRGDAPQYFSAAVMFGVGTYLVTERLRRRARDEKFDSNLLGDLDRAIAQADYQIRRIRTMPLWFFAPVALPVLFHFVVAYESTPLWKWVLVLLAFPLGIYVSRLELECMHLPRKRELEALRAKLTSES